MKILITSAKIPHFANKRQLERQNKHHAYTLYIIHTLAREKDNIQKGKTPIQNNDTYVLPLQNTIFARASGLFERKVISLQQ